MNAQSNEVAWAEYAGFLVRFGATLMDGIVILPVALATFWLSPATRDGRLGAELFFVCFWLVYQIYCHGRWGKTLGKHLAGIRVLTVDFQPIGYGRSLLRSSGDIFLQALNVYSVVTAYSLLADSDFTLGWIDFQTKVDQVSPKASWPAIAGNIWFWSEVIVMMTNHKRRSFHDFIAGTVVCKHLIRI